MIKDIIMTKLIRCVNAKSNSGHAYVTMCSTNKVIYILTPGPKRRHFGIMAKMGL